MPADLGAQVDPEGAFWTTYDGTSGGRFCEVPEIVGAIDADRSGTLSPREYVNFFRENPARDAFRKVAVRHVSEWGDKGDFEASLAKARDFGGLPKAARHKLYAEQIESMQWWGDVLGATGLPYDKIAWHYHPIQFVAWLHDKMKGSAQRSKGVEGELAFAGKAAPDHIKDDTSDSAEGFTDDEDELFGEAAKKLDLEALSRGYPD